jgi:phage virion morphogenesis protein
MVTAQPVLYLDFKPSLKVTAGHYEAVGVEIRSFREPLKRSVQQVIIPSIRKNFDSGGRPGWAPYADITIEFHQELGEAMSQGMLNKTGKLKQTMGYFNIWSVDREKAELRDLPANIWYGKIHQAGYGGRGGKYVIPARPFVMLQPDDEQKIVEVFDKWLEERINKVWAR